MQYNKTSLLSATNKVNKRFLKGLNDDDQVAKMFEIAKKTKGYFIKPNFDTYEVCTDYEYLLNICIKFGYWSEQVKNFNTILIHKGGLKYESELNNKVKQELKTIN